MTLTKRQKGQAYADVMRRCRNDWLYSKWGETFCNVHMFAFLESFSFSTLNSFVVRPVFAPFEIKPVDRAPYPRQFVRSFWLCFTKRDKRHFASDVPQTSPALGFVQLHCIDKTFSASAYSVSIDLEASRCCHVLLFIAFNLRATTSIGRHSLPVLTSSTNVAWWKGPG